MIPTAVNCNSVWISFHYIMQVHYYYILDTIVSIVQSKCCEHILSGN